MKNALLFLLIFLFFSSTAFTQKTQDFIINLNGDTLWGEIKLPARSQVLTFKADKTKVRFRPNALERFGLYSKRKKEYIQYQSVRINKVDKKFLKIIAAGDLKLFEEKVYVSGRRGLAVKTIYYVGRTAESLHFMAPYAYEEIMQHFFKDVPKINQQLTQATFFDIPDLVTAYNNTGSD